VRAEEFVGQKVRKYRQALGVTQDELGRRVGDRLGKRWPRQVVCNAEKGDRSLGAAEIVALAEALMVDVAALVEPDAGQVWQIEMPGGGVIELRGDTRDPRVLLDEIQKIERRMHERANANNVDAAELAMLRKSLADMRGAQSLTSKSSA
jgi:transcriptional regulator with XRE-family HTH domain